MKLVLFAIGLFLVIDGLFPFISPKAWKKVLVEMLEFPDDKIRLIAFVSVALGLILIWFTEL